MYFSDADIRQELTDNWTQIEDSTSTEDLLWEWADSACPVYYNDILKDWAEMPNEFTDSWQDGGFDSESGIFTLMGIDLFNYYRTQYNIIYAEILAEKEAALEIAEAI